MPKVSIGACTYKGAKRLDWCLQSIFQVGGLEEFDAKIVILDDGSPDKGAAVDALGKKYGVPVILHQTNRGIPASWNSLTEYHKAPITILLNDDILVSPGWLHAMVYFLENNPKAGSASWPFYFINTDDMPKVLAGEKVTPRDPITKQPDPSKIATYEYARSGRLMCPAGSCFAFKKEMYELSKKRHESFGLTGGFPEEFLSFHEESSFGTALAEAGFASYGLTAPHLWHVWSATFGDSPELNAGWRIQHSRGLYNKIWEVPEKFHGNPFEFTNPKFLPRIPPNEIKWVDKNGNFHAEVEPDTRPEHL